MRGWLPSRGLAWLAAVVGVLAVVVCMLAAPAGAAAGEADHPRVRDLAPTKLERGDTLVVELEGGAPRGPAIVILRATASSMSACVMGPNIVRMVPACFRQ